MSATHAAAKANQAGMLNFNYPAFGRPGGGDPHERLKDMDTDQVDTEVLYCEVSAYRFLYKMSDGWKEATARVQRRAHRLRLRRSQASRRLVPDPDP